MADNTQLGGLEFQIEGFSQEAIASLENLKKTVSSVRSVFQNTQTKIEGTSNQINKLNSALGKINIASSKKLENLSKALAELSKAGSPKISGTIAKGIVDIGSALELVDDSTFSKLGELSTALGRFSNIGKSSIGPVINQLKKLPEVSEALEGMDMSKFKAQMDELAEAMQKLSIEMAQIGRGFQALPAKMQKIIAGTNKMGNAMQKTAKKASFFNRVVSTFGRFFAVERTLRAVSRALGQGMARASDYTEALNMFSVAMGEYAKEAFAYGRKFADAFGIDMTDWIKNQAVFQTLLTGFGNAADKAAFMSKNLTQLGFDLSSFFNISIPEAMQKLQSGIAGELEPLNLAA